MVRRLTFVVAALFGALASSALEPDRVEAAPLATWDGASQCLLAAEPQFETATTPPPPPPAAPEPACPAEMAQVGVVCIDRYEAHLVTVGPTGEERKHPHYERPESGVVYQARSRPGEFPQAYVSRIEAERACSAAGKRLCSYGEWRRACQGATGQAYPYGDTHRPGVCNTGKEHLFSKVFGSNPHHWGHAEFNSPELNKQPNALTKTGSLGECRTDDGVFDMVGNVHEWVSDAVTMSFVEGIKTDGHVRHEQPWRPGNAMFMGGFYATTTEHGPGCHFVTVAHNRRYHDYTTGFRCCRDARSAT